MGSQVTERHATISMNARKPLTNAALTRRVRTLFLVSNAKMRMVAVMTLHATMRLRLLILSATEPAGIAYALHVLPEDKPGPVMTARVLWMRVVRASMLAHVTMDTVPMKAA